jgi:hypothetical protein
MYEVETVSWQGSTHKLNCVKLKMFLLTENVRLIFRKEKFPYTSPLGWNFLFRIDNRLPKVCLLFLPVFSLLI